MVKKNPEIEHYTQYLTEVDKLPEINRCCLRDIRYDEIIQVAMSKEFGKVTKIDIPNLCSQSVRTALTSRIIKGTLPLRIHTLGKSIYLLKLV